LRAFLLGLSLLGLSLGSTAASQRISLFDGKSLQGWEGDPEYFRVQQSCIVAGRLDRPIRGNQFLVSDQEFHNFDLVFESKLIGKGTNAGVQFWSQRVPKSTEMIGYQCDIGSFKDGFLWGWLYDESRRNKFLATTSQQELSNWVNPKGAWNHMRVLAQKKKISIWLNNNPTITYEEKDQDIPMYGKFGLQVHGGPPLEVWYKNIAVKELN
jgi:hypothetical protein